MRAFEWAAAVPWAIEQDTLREILRIARRQDLDPDAVAARLGRPLDNTQTATVRDGVAIVPVSGPVFRYANLFTAISGATSLELLARDFTKAVDDPGVRAVLLAVDSPGGQVNGIHEMGNMIFAARAAKPIEAYVSGTAASAAYWLASAAERITVDATARLGSIGIAAAILDTRERDRKAGIEQIEIVSSNAPDKRPDPQTERGRAGILAELDRLEAIFIAAVARHRGTTADRVIADFGRGGLRIGADAVAVGMADALGSFEQILAGLAGRTRSGAAGRSASRKETGMHDDIEPAAESAAVAETTNATGAIARDQVTADLIAREFPQVAKELTHMACADAITAERARITLIDDLALPGHEALAARAKADGIAVDAFLLDQTRAERNRQGQRLADLAADAADLPAIAAQPQALSSPAVDSRALAANARKLVDDEAREGRVISYAEAVRRIRDAA